MEGIPQPYLGDLPTMVLNHLLIGMILQVRTPSRACKEKILRVSCRSSEGFRDPATRRNAWCGLGFAGGFLGIAGFETARNEIGWNEKLKAKIIARNIIFQSFMNLDSILIFRGRYISGKTSHLAVVHHHGWHRFFEVLLDLEERYPNFTWVAGEHQPARWCLFFQPQNFRENYVYLILVFVFSWWFFYTFYHRIQHHLKPPFVFWLFFPNHLTVANQRIWPLTRRNLKPASSHPFMSNVIDTKMWKMIQNRIAFFQNW